MPKSPPENLTKPERLHVFDTWFYWLTPLCRAAARERDPIKRAAIAKLYFEICEAVGFGGVAPIRRTPREATT